MQNRVTQRKSVWTFFVGAGHLPGQRTGTKNKKVVEKSRNEKSKPAAGKATPLTRGQQLGGKPKWKSVAKINSGRGKNPRHALARRKNRDGPLGYDEPEHIYEDRNKTMTKEK
jgi:hypothetical protein